MKVERSTKRDHVLRQIKLYKIGLMTFEEVTKILDKIQVRGSFDKSVNLYDYELQEWITE